MKKAGLASRNENDILVIKVNMLASAKDMKAIRKNVLMQKQTGVVVLPAYCEPVIVPADIEIKIEGKEVPK